MWDLRWLGVENSAHTGLLYSVVASPMWLGQPATYPILVKVSFQVHKDRDKDDKNRSWNQTPSP